MVSNRELCKILCLSIINNSKNNWHAYKLKKYINDNYPNINNSNIYPAIRLLHEEKFIDTSLINDLKIFSINELGKQKLEMYKKESLKIIDIIGGDYA